MNAYHIGPEHDNDEVYQTVLDGLLDYNVSVVGPHKAGPFRIGIRDESGEVVGGATGKAILGWVSVDLIWIREDLRGKGLGRRLLLAIEEEARSLGATSIMLDTFEFQAEGFYKKHGYVEYGRIENFVENYDRIYLTKRNI